MKDCTSRPPKEVTQGDRKTVTPMLPSHSLFGSAREIIIDHLGVEYRLRRTRNGKLLLYK